MSSSEHVIPACALSLYSLFFLSLAALTLPNFLWANSENPSKVCQAAIIRVSLEEDIPIATLREIAPLRVGSQGSGELQPWPWTIAVRGQRIWFDTEAQAKNHILSSFRSGNKQFQIGCFQIDYQKHSREFGSIEEMFDPVSNTRFAAQNLLRWNEALGDWNLAAQVFRNQNWTAEQITYFNKNGSGATNQIRNAIVLDRLPQIAGSRPQIGRSFESRRVSARASPNLTELPLQHSNSRRSR